MANKSDDHCSGYTGLFAETFRVLLILLLAIGIIMTIVRIFEDFGMVLTGLGLILAYSIGLVGAYYRNWKILAILGVASVVFGIVLYITSRPKSIDDLKREEEEEMARLALQYDPGVPPSSTDKDRANLIWDRWHRTGCCGSAGPSDWVQKYGKAGPPRSCCKSEEDWDTLRNTCKLPYEKGCSEAYLGDVKEEEEESIWVKVYQIHTWPTAVMSLFMAYVYYAANSRDNTFLDLGRQSGNIVVSKMPATSQTSSIEPAPMSQTVEQAMRSAEGRVASEVPEQSAPGKPLSKIDAAKSPSGRL